MVACVYLDVELNRGNLLGACDAVLEIAPQRVILLGDEPAMRERLRCAGLQVDVLPAGTRPPPGARQIGPVLGNARSRAYVAYLKSVVERLHQGGGD